MTLTVMIVSNITYFFVCFCHVKFVSELLRSGRRREKKYNPTFHKFFVEDTHSQKKKKKKIHTIKEIRHASACCHLSQSLFHTLENIAVMRLNF